ncbi:hypothetical protein NL676_017784 [Syzygium grande]|nr:hypothetical protein NL676_017784 [Syzygium grande]
MLTPTRCQCPGPSRLGWGPKDSPKVSHAESPRGQPQVLDARAGFPGGRDPGTLAHRCKWVRRINVEEILYKPRAELGENSTTGEAETCEQISDATAPQPSLSAGPSTKARPGFGLVVATGQRHPAVGDRLSFTKSPSNLPTEKVLMFI